jgi:thioesterase domain-containing protein/SAM-dependent methyltransferase/acyl carrier protein
VEHRSERIYIHLLREAITRMVRTSPGRKIRVLEVGGGQGVLTWPVASALAAEDVEYCFTDIGKAFVDDAREEAARRRLDGLMTFGLLDISRDATAQGFEAAAYDLVLAFNVVHATPDLRKTLRHLEALVAPGGALGLVEMVRARRWDLLTWGLAEGWWYYDDGIRRGSPLLDVGAWEALLRGEGCEPVEAFPRGEEERARADHALVLAWPRAQTATPRAEAAPRPAASADGAPARHTAAHPRPALRTPYVAPRNDTERQIAALCGELLGVDRIGVHDDFFELGADSLITLRISDRVRRELGREVPAAAAFRGATVERIARALDPAPSLPPSPILVPLQPGGTRPPLFFIHPAAGVVFPYVELSRQLGPDQPFYGLQAAGLDGASPPDATISAMARRYVDAIRTVAPEGPYHLGGFSFGCLVAYEVAQELCRAGDEVRLLALIDEPAPLSGHRPTPVIMAKLLTTGIAKSIWPYLHDYFYLTGAADEPRAGGAHPHGAPAAHHSGAPARRRNGTAGGVRAAAAALADLARWRPDGDLLQSFLARSTMANYVPREARLLALRQPAMIPMFQLFMIHLRETLDYMPKAYPHRVTYFKATRLGGRNARDPTMGWGTLAAGGVDVHDLPGDHLTVLRQPHVRVLAEKLRACLDAAQRSGGR